MHQKVGLRVIALPHNLTCAKKKSFIFFVVNTCKYSKKIVILDTANIWKRFHMKENECTRDMELTTFYLTFRT